MPEIPWLLLLKCVHLLLFYFLPDTKLNNFGLLDKMSNFKMSPWFSIIFDGLFSQFSNYFILQTKNNQYKNVDVLQVVLNTSVFICEFEPAAETVEIIVVNKEISCFIDIGKKQIV